MSYPTIQLGTTVKVQSAVNTSEIEIIQAVDDPIGKTVKSLVKICGDPYAHNWYTVWSGDSYIAIGNWTDAQLSNAVVEIVLAEYPPA